MLESYPRSHLGDLPVDAAPSRSEIRSGAFYLGVKRILDIGVILLIAPLALTIVGVLAFLIHRDGGKAFYGQKRLGRDGKIFTLWKLRSMVPDAALRLEEYLQDNPAARREWDGTQKLKYDPRITRLGYYLRKYSADELPQLWNVLIGDMSLVGPRPMFPEQRPLYPGTAYFSMRPGMTGLWQISERNGCTFAERATHDTRYATKMSFGTDIWILMMTAVVVLRGTGL
ncbi:MULTISPECIES: sugar transferase [unclassified Mesorhizobium]|jgi:exopolysaccharide production protein ExoY|uniref:sugar transferase n=1 Tax=unclassified Mesorhizobium TaxID=325217 RepID=UPI0008E63E36|nr:MULTISPECIES: sugar transferase [unclassified Mesorhizobium]RJG43355.1 sugar transferase [Mesorhizobium sp. DCY119]SFU09386.1 Sugar transferase involved in LPS biosynthesis (colanic, teichoic acid) [Mesorhizobium sp. YR577]